MQAERPDVLVVGAGVIGLSIAHRLLRAGRSVCVVDRAHPGAGASHGNCGTITPSHAPPLAAPGVIRKALGWTFRPDAPLYIPLRWDPDLWRWLWKFAGRSNQRDWWQAARAKADLLNASRQRLQHWIEREAVACGFESSGLLYAYRDAAAFDAHCAAHAPLAQLGIRFEVLDAATMHRREPLLRDAVAGGIHFPDDACLRPDRLVAELVRLIEADQGTIRGSAEVVRIDRRGKRVQLADGQWLGAGKIVLATGAWSPRFAADLGVPIPLQPGKGYSLTFERPARAPAMPMVLRERAVCVTTWADGFRLGSTMEFSGYNDSPNPVRLDALARGAQEYLDLPVDRARGEAWHGWRPMTWDDLPLIGPLPDAPDIVLATGHGMLGVSMSAATADLVVDRLCGRDAEFDAAPYRVERFA